MESVLLKDGNKYSGQYVATRSFENRSVVSHGSDPGTVYQEARDQGISEPVVFYVPKPGMVQIH